MSAQDAILIRERTTDRHGRQLVAAARDAELRARMGAAGLERVKTCWLGARVRGCSRLDELFREIVAPRCFDGTLARDGPATSVASKRCAHGRTAAS